ncbi:hypothetical protein B0H21DRAFT_290690 [Amylocystis lapponica]|nr:hypothetical protein B0H21DRAFT_290690 [Amylocystis lapponica]
MLPLPVDRDRAIAHARSTSINCAGRSPSERRDCILSSHICSRACMLTSLTYHTASPQHGGTTLLRPSRGDRRDDCPLSALRGEGKSTTRRARNDFFSVQERLGRVLRMGAPGLPAGHRQPRTPCLVCARRLFLGCAEQRRDGCRRARPGLSFVVWHLGQRRLATSTCLEFPVDEIVAHPKYESCTPAGRNVKVLDDPKLLRFIQYAGEPGFDEVEHSKIYKTGFTWQSSSHIDPDGMSRTLLSETRENTLA